MISGSPDKYALCGQALHFFSPSWAASAGGGAASAAGASLMMGPGERAMLKAGGVLGPSLRPGVLGFVDGGTVKTAGRSEAKRLQD